MKQGWQNCEVPVAADQGGWSGRMIACKTVYLGLKLLRLLVALLAVQFANRQTRTHIALQALDLELW